MKMKLVVLLTLFLASVSFSDETANKWRHETADDAANYTEVFVLRQNSSATIKDASAKNDVTPQLEFRCSSGDPTVTARIDWQRFISSFSTEAGFKVDGGKFTWLKWKVDSSEKITISPSAADSQRLMDLLGNGKELLVDISPYSAAPVQAYFDISTLSTELSSLTVNCQ